MANLQGGVNIHSCRVVTLSYSGRDVRKIAAGTGAAIALNRDLLCATESLFQQGQYMKAIHSTGERIPCAMTLIVALRS